MVSGKNSYNHLVEMGFERGGAERKTSWVLARRLCLTDSSEGDHNTRKGKKKVERKRLRTKRKKKFPPLSRNHEKEGLAAPKKPPYQTVQKGW